MTSGRWYQLGGVAGIAYAVVAAIAAALTGLHPPPAASSEEVRAFFVDKQAALVTQGWLFALGAALLIWFALALRGILRNADRQLGDLFLVGTAVAAGLSLVAMSIQIVIAKSAARLSPEAVRVVGFDFVLAQYLLCGFIVATTVTAYAACVFRGAALPRWTGWLAVVSALLNLLGTLSVFVSNGPASVRGTIVIWLPGIFTTVWYLGTAVALLQVSSRLPEASR